MYSAMHTTTYLLFQTISVTTLENDTSECHSIVGDPIAAPRDRREVPLVACGDQVTLLTSSFDQNKHSSDYYKKCKRQNFNC